MTNRAYTPGTGGETDGSATGLRSSTDALPQTLDGTGQTARWAVGDKVQHRLSGATGEVVDLHADPFVKEVTHGIVNWTGDGDGFGQGYASTNLIKF